ncbi:phospholipase [Campylobacter sp. MIT 99-7217]|uniref:phospholipase D family protein n=1 Tax=Campylobacter sp. MIT 99-7217 TaxID=535091 RepID=UPI001156D9F1|nr:phospholipase D family protein [Campylobacter sp. MIT 99-7217]TQR31267.1 phospholipase [Campylobacter sp. MIT 99-7217]
MGIFASLIRFLMIKIFFVSLAFLFSACSLMSISIKDTNLSQTSFVKDDFDPLQTPLGQIHLQDFIQNPQKSGALFINDGKQALLHRTALVKMAQKSIILQTYIYKNDPESRLLMFELWRAANRGVEVKILIDDNGLDSDFSDIITLDSHPNIEVKIFNPYRTRSTIPRYAEMVYDFKRITHRMHNKIFIVDNIALIIGGRNVADNYFEANSQVNFSDSDAIFIGPVVKEALENFKLYWSYDKSVNASLLPSKNSMEDYLEEINTNLQGFEKSSKGWIDYNEIMDKFLTAYEEKRFAISWGRAKFLGDLPQKIEKEEIIYPINDAFLALSKDLKKSLYIVSAYFVPGDTGLELIADLKKRGVEVITLTNSLSSMDSVVVYAAWQRYRDKLLEQGVKVYEYSYHGKNKKSNLRDKIGSSSSLHSKIIVFDESITWIGSFNLDPRSKDLNTESIVVFENENFAKKVQESIKEDIKASWQLQRQNGKTTWQGYNEKGELETHTSDPDTSVILRFFNFLSKILPENQI